MFALGGNVLVVDDGVGFTRDMAAKLAGRGYKADYSFSTTSAIDRLADNGIDLVILSCAGNVTCLEMVNQIRQVFKDIPIVSFEAPEQTRKCDYPDIPSTNVISLKDWNPDEAIDSVVRILEEIMRNSEIENQSGNLLFAKGKQVDVQLLGIHKSGILSSMILRRDERYLYLGEPRDFAGKTYDVIPRQSIKVGVSGRDAHYNFTSQAIQIIREPNIVIQIEKPVVIYRTQRRKHPRFPMRIPVRMATYSDDVDIESIEANGVTKDISRGGIRLVVDEYIEPGEAIMLDIPMPENKGYVAGLAFVLRSYKNTTQGESGYILACKFCKIDENIDELLTGQPVEHE